MTRNEILAIPDTEQGRRRLRELAGKWLTPGPWEHHLFACEIVNPNGPKRCRRCNGQYGGKTRSEEYYWAPGHKGLQFFSVEKTCPVPPPAVGSLADIAEGLKDEVKQRHAHKALWDVIDECKYAKPGDGLAWLYWHAGSHKQVAVLLAALEGE